MRPLLRLPDARPLLTSVLLLAWCLATPARAFDRDCRDEGGDGHGYRERGECVWTSRSRFRAASTTAST